MEEAAETTTEQLEQSTRRAWEHPWIIILAGAVITLVLLFIWSTAVPDTFTSIFESLESTDVEQARLDLLIAKAKEISGDEGIRYLIGEKVADEIIVEALELTDEQLAEVHAAIAAEKAERDRVAGLLEKVADKPKDEQVKHLFENNVTEALIMEMAGVDQGVNDAVKKAMEEELKEKQRLAEEEAARKAAEAEGPSLDDIPSDELIDFIDSIREIMEFSDVEKEIRTMCEQSAIPKALVDIAVSDPDKLDELEKIAEGRACRCLRPQLVWPRPGRAAR